LSHADKDALIRALFAQLHGLAERVKALEAENAALRGSAESVRSNCALLEKLLTPGG